MATRSRMCWNLTWNRVVNNEAIKQGSHNHKKRNKVPFIRNSKISFTKLCIYKSFLFVIVNPSFILFHFFNRLMKGQDRKSTRLNSSHVSISYAVFSLKKKRSMTHVTIENTI